MALKEYKNLTQDEVYRGDLLSLRIMLAVVIHHLLDGSPNADAIYKQLASATAQIVAEIPLQAVEPKRQQAFRDLIVERAEALLTQAKSIRHEMVRSH